MNNKISHFNNFNVYNLVALSTLTILSTTIVFHSRAFFITHSYYFLSLLLQPLATTNQLPVSWDLYILGISYKWNHIICDLLCLFFFFFFFTERKERADSVAL